MYYHGEPYFLMECTNVQSSSGIIKESPNITMLIWAYSYTTGEYEVQKSEIDLLATFH